jgi:hypothetical protein
MVLQSSLRLQDLIISDCRLLEERNPRFAGTTAQFLALFAP